MSLYPSLLSLTLGLGLLCPPLFLSAGAVSVPKKQPGPADGQPQLGLTPENCSSGCDVGKNATHDAPLNGTLTDPVAVGPQNSLSSAAELHAANRSGPAGGRVSLQDDPPLPNEQSPVHQIGAGSDPAGPIGSSQPAGHQIPVASPFIPPNSQRPSPPNVTTETKHRSNIATAEPENKVQTNATLTKVTPPPPPPTTTTPPPPPTTTTPPPTTTTPPPTTTTTTPPPTTTTTTPSPPPATTTPPPPSTTPTTTTTPPPTTTTPPPTTTTPPPSTTPTTTTMPPPSTTPTTTTTPPPSTTPTTTTMPPPATTKRSSTTTRPTTTEAKATHANATVNTSPTPGTKKTSSSTTAPPPPPPVGSASLSSTVTTRHYVNPGSPGAKVDGMADAGAPLTMRLVDTASLLAALLFGLLFFLVAVSLFVTQAYDSYRTKDYTQVDYLINGMYTDSGV